MPHWLETSSALTVLADAAFASETGGRPSFVTSVWALVLPASALAWAAWTAWDAGVAAALMELTCAIP
jgi:hypothetical protein